MASSSTSGGTSLMTSIWASQRYVAATPRTSSPMRSTRSRMSAGSNTRMVPASTQVSGMTLAAAPAWKEPMVSATSFMALTSRAMSSCSARCTCTPAVMGSTPVSGADPWQPLPVSTMRKP